MNHVFPRLDPGASRVLLVERTDLPLDRLRSLAATEHPNIDWYPTGGSRVSQDRLMVIRDKVCALSAEYGWPSAPTGGFTEFEHRLYDVLLGTLEILPADAADEGVWSFLTLVLLPDVAFWRFPNTQRSGSYERLIGRPRNVFRRLWWRAYVLGTDLAGQLLEDEAVAIMERPTLGGSPMVARAIAETHLGLVREKGSLPRTTLMREATKRLRRLTTILTLHAMDQADLHEVVQEVFLETAFALGQDI
ncbi:DUF6339 family protein [Pseudofrankia sp. BMG5.36]|uniref:DUF6339 family protein n=1 Tax=Pseudofrankia sp. BMG5.36 TaxID=1834512 RepID=UPI0008D9DA0C|nr:DUF6339 family protein [Pseudofrankia sp. BMG5.36]OHV43329.1 hypothetical protein BCD48_28470 [Pseudofrankia sp. BMG5.36]